MDLLFLHTSHSWNIKNDACLAACEQSNNKILTVWATSPVLSEFRHAVLISPHFCAQDHFLPTAERLWHIAVTSRDSYLLTSNLIISVFLKCCLFSLSFFRSRASETFICTTGHSNAYQHLSTLIALPPEPRAIHLTSSPATHFTQPICAVSTVITQASLPPALPPHHSSPPYYAPKILNLSWPCS